MGRSSRAIASRTLGSLLVLASCAATTARADAPRERVTVVDPIDVPPEHDPLAHAGEVPGRRGGFYARLSTGLGFQSTRLGPPEWESSLDGATVTGFGTGYGLQLGGLVRDWVALHLDGHVGVLWHGDIDELYVLGSGGGGRIVAYGFAPAVTFFTPLDFYFTPAFGVGFATLKWPGASETTDPGFYMNLVVGKDLYTGPYVSVGVQFQIVYMLLGNDDEDYQARVREYLFGVSFGFDSGG